MSSKSSTGQSQLNNLDTFSFEETKGKESDYELSPNRQSVVILDVIERTKRYGIECLGPKGDGISFLAGQWRPGGEYVQKLIVRNVSSTVKKMKYKLPTTRYFSMAYPELIILSPGMSQEVDVIFRPVEYEPYDDTVYFKMLNGSSGGFHVPVKAFIDKLIVSVPYGVDLGYCPVHQTSSMIFRLENSGEVNAPFRWEAPIPFVLEPMEGVIPIGTFVDIKVSVYPVDASVFVAQAVCYIGEGEEANAIIPYPIISSKISAIGKYTYIVLSETEVNYGEVLSGTPVDKLKKEVLLRNNSVVPAEFQLERCDNDTDEVFDILPKSGIIDALSFVTISITYRPLAMGSYSLDRYTFRTPSNSCTTLTLKGMSMAPVVSLYRENLLKPSDLAGETIKNDGQVTAVKSLPFVDGSPANSINFRDVELGKTETRVLFLKNDTNKAVMFSIVGYEESTFKLFPKQGIIPALATMYPVKIEFSPDLPINFYRRMFILISDALPLFMDCMGSGYIRAKGEIKEQRPWPLRHAHVQAYRNRNDKGMGKVDPDELEKLYQDFKDGIARVPSEMFALVGLNGTKALSVTSLQNPLTRTGETTRVAIAPAHELFISDNDDTARDITIDKSELDFGYTPYGRMSEYKTVVVTNNTYGKVCVVWKLPKTSGLESDFTVDPMTVDLPSSSSQKFKVYFKPLHSDRNYLSELEVFIYFKNQRTFRLVDDACMTPPWCLPLSCCGHTFETGQLLAKVMITGGNVSRGKLLFPTTFINEANYQTVILRNTSNLPSTYQVELAWDSTSTGMKKYSNDEAFTVKPALGEIPADGFVLVCIRFLPKSYKKHSQMIRLVVNGDKCGQLLLEGIGASPYILPCNTSENDKKQVEALGIGKDGFLNGLTTSRRLKFKNGTRLPLRYVLSLPAESASIVALSQYKGILRGNEEVEISVIFAPILPMKYTYKLKLKTFPIGGIPNRVIDARQPGGVQPPECLQSFSIYLICPGEIGALKFDPPRVSTGVQLVNTTESRDIFLENTCDCDVQYKLWYSAELTPDGTKGVPKEKEFYEYAPLGTLSSNNASSYSQEILYCEKPEGILRSRSRLRITFVFRPNDAGFFEIAVNAQVKALGTDGLPLMLSNEESALLRISQNDREQSFFNNTRYHKDQINADSISDIPLVACITGRASFPTLLVEDIRLDINNTHALVHDVEQLWRQFSLSELNYDLSVPLTAEEIALNSKSSPAIEDFKRYEFQFTPQVIGSQTQTVHLQVRNNGFLTSSFHVHLSNEKGLNLEQWCDEDDPSEELNKIISIIEEMKVFTFSPRSGTLLPGESVIITCSYSHSHLKYNGVHKIPILLKIDNGKQFYLDLCGRTLALPTDVTRKSEAPVVGTPHTSNIGAVSELLIITSTNNNIVRLDAVPVGFGVNDAPRQRTEIINVCGVDLNYEVDMKIFAEIAEKNNNLPLLMLANPKGTVKAYSNHYLEWYFFPIEARTYTFPLVITYTVASNTVSISTNNVPQSPKKRGAHRVINSVICTLEIVGYDIRSEKPCSYGSDYNGGVPSSMRLITQQPQYIHPSVDIINFSTVLQACTTSRILILKNLFSEPMDYRIDHTNYLFEEKILSVFPSAGSIGPHDMVVIEFKLNTTDCSPAFIAEHITIVCRQIIQEKRSRRGGVNSVCKSRKTASAQSQRDCVLFKCTSSQASRMANTPIPAGRTASLPSTVNQDGEIIIGSKTDGGDIIFESGSILSVENLSGTIADVTLTHEESTMKSSSTPKTETKKSRSRSASSSPTRQGTIGTKMSDTIIREGKSNKDVLLLGPAQFYYIRIKGEIITVDQASTLYTLGPQAGVLDEYVSVATQFIPNKTSYVITNGIAEHKKAKPKVTLDVDKARTNEIRFVTENILSDLFRTLVSSPIIEKTIGDILIQRISGGAVGVLKLVDTENGEKKVIGQPRYGVHALDVKENFQLLDLLVRELKYLSGINTSNEQYESNELLLHDAAKYTMNVDVLISKLQYLGVDNSICNGIMKTYRGDVVIKNMVVDLSESSKIGIKKSAASHYTKRICKKKESNKAEFNEPSKVDDNSLVATLSQSGFIDTAEAILKNTMFNLIQEAVYGEYAIAEDPLSFATFIQE